MRSFVTFLAMLVCLAVPQSVAAGGFGGPMLDEGQPLLLNVGHTKKVTSLGFGPGDSITQEINFLHSHSDFPSR